jgi:hypothetical protein
MVPGCSIEVSAYDLVRGTVGDNASFLEQDATLTKLCDSLKVV